MSVRLLLLGTPTVDDDGLSRPLLFERRHQLLAYLATRGGWVPRSELAALLWPDQSDKLAYANVRKVLHRLQELSWLLGFEVQSHALRLEVATDTAAFEAALREGRVAEALAWRRGEFLSGYDDPSNEAWTQWLQQERERWRTLWRGTVLDHLTSLGEAGQRIELSSQLLAIDAFDEAALRAHAEALLEAGHGARAQAVWQEFVARLQRELGVEPSSALRAWHDGWTRSGSGAVPNPRPPAPRSQASTSDGFIGRSAELHRIDALLSGNEVRLLTLIGPGGVGKTRLARRLLGELGGRFSGGAAFVSLEDVADAAQLVPRIAREIGLVLTDRGHVLDQVVAELEEREQLLVLDNLEQLAGQAQVLVQLLHACARLVIVATSRVRLALPGEQLFPLQGLPCPDAEDQDRLEAFDAARLFIRAARHVEPALVPSAEAAAIVEICRLVDGLPLALELAASWTRAMSCEAIAEELRRGTELLSTADPARPTRQASIAAVFEQSWAHLGASERRALAALSLFRGGFTAGAARQVAGASAPVLASLADRSLLRRDDTGRLQLHPLVQQFAAEKLACDAQALTQARRAHADHFIGWLAGLRRASEEGDRDVLTSIDAEWENCRTAWLAALALFDAPVLLSAAEALHNRCEHRARFEDGLMLMQAALDAMPRDTATASVLRSFAASLAQRLARYGEAQRLAQDAWSTLRTGRMAEAKYRVLRVLGGCAQNTGRFKDALNDYQRALAQAQAAGLPHAIAGTLENIALVEKRLGHYDASLRRSQEALVLHRRNRDAAAEALCLSNLASLCMFLHDDATAHVYLTEGLALARHHGLVSTQAYVLANLTELAQRARDWAAAAAHAADALTIAEQTGMRQLAAWLRVQLARGDARGGRLEQARASLAVAADLSLQLAAPSVQAAVVLGAAEILDAQGEEHCARRVLGFASEQATLSAPDRAELRAEWARRPAPKRREPAWPGIELQDLLGRLVSERDLRYEPLIRTLG